MRNLLFTLGLLALAGGAIAQVTPADTTSAFDPVDEPTWAVGAALRVADIPFATEERTVSTFIPFVYYDHDKTFYFRGLEGGVTFWRPGKWRLSAMGRLRFFDIPEQDQNVIQGDNALLGLQARYLLTGPYHLDLEVLSDLAGHELANARLGARWDKRQWTLRAYLQAQYKTKRFNSYYFGLNQVDVGDGIELGLGASALRNLASNFFVFGRAEFSYLDKATRGSALVDRNVTAQAYLGLGFSNDPTRTTPSVRKTRPYWRVSHGWVTPSSLADIMNFEAESDPGNNQMTSIFYGHPLSDTLLGLPLSVYFTSGFGWHWPVQKQSIAEFVLGVKLYYTVPWPIRWKLGAAEGWSWVTDIPYVEDERLRDKGYEPSQLLNYLDFSVDFNIGDITGGETMKRTWLGYGIHHRSAIFESAQQFGRIKGGSNVQTVYLQVDF